MAERTVAWKPRSENKILGTYVERIDGVEKASGRAKYSTDVNPAGTLHARLLGGEPGAGKTRLAQETAVRAHERGAFFDARFSS